MKRSPARSARIALAGLALSLGAVGGTLAACTDCGTVTAVSAYKKEGQASGVGAVAGGVGGALLGNQFGKGGGKTALTVAGAAGGAYAGHQVEKSMKSTTGWNVAVKMDNGETRKFSFGAEPAFKQGDKVKVRDGRLVLRD